MSETPPSSAKTAAGAVFTGGRVAQNSPLDGSMRIAAMKTDDANGKPVEDLRPPHTGLTSHPSRPKPTKTDLPEIQIHSHRRRPRAAACRRPARDPPWPLCPAHAQGAPAVPGAAATSSSPRPFGVGRRHHRGQGRRQRRQA